MKHVIFEQNAQNKYEIAVLVRESALDKAQMERHYVKPLVSLGIEENTIIGFSLKYTDKGTCPAKFIKEYLASLLKSMDSIGITTLLVSDASYFKVITNSRKTEPFHGYIKPCAIKDFEHINVILSINYKQLFFNPALQEKLDLSLNTLVKHVNGTHIVIGSDIIHYEYYANPNNEFTNAALSSIEQVLNSLHKYDVLSSDIEAFSLKFNDAGVGTISFAWNQHNGIGFPVDYVPLREPCAEIKDGPLLYGFQEDNKHVKNLLRDFFEAYQGKLIWHNANYDLKVLIYNLWMVDLLDIEGLLKGLEVMTRLIDDTKIIAYLATNSTAGNDLKLKNLAHEFAGNYAQEDINDIRRIPLPELLKYNLTDCLATWFVHNKFYPIMVKDDQKYVYDEILIPSVKVILQMELTGMPMDDNKIIDAKKELSAIANKHLHDINNSTIISEFTLQMRKEEMIKKNLLLKVKVKPLSDFDDINFNPNSNVHLQKLLYEKLEFEVQKRTNTGQPATGSKVISAIMNQLINKYGLTEEELK